MFSSPYDTTAIPVYDIVALRTDLETAKVEGGLVSGLIPDAPHVLSVINNEIVSLFPHPVTFTSVVDNRMYTAVDLRPYRSQLRQVSENNVEIPKSGSIPFNLMRARIQHVWNQPQHPDLFNLSTLPQKVFSLWVSSAIVNAFRLDAETAFRLQIVAAFWYMGQFDPQGKRALDEREVVGYASAIYACTRITLERCIEEIGAINHTIVTAKDFVEAVIPLNATRFKTFTVGTLFTLMATSWFGSTAVREVVAVALEYPPTYLAMVWSAIHERTYRNTPIGQIIGRLNRDNTAAVFSQNLERVLKYSGS